MYMQKILIGGGSGLVGSNLKAQLESLSYDVYILSRKKTEASKQRINWNLETQQMDLQGLKPDVIINLTGAGIADKPWTKERKKVLIDSRVNSTSIFEKYIKSGALNPRVYISASAVGIYGDRGEEVLTEESSIGDSSAFLVKCCALWEQAAQRLEPLVERLAVIRIGLVLSNQGGALEKIQTPVKLGGAAYFGDGNQYYPWIHIDDLSRSIIHVIENKACKGIYNGVGPNPVSMKTFMKTLKAHIRSWALSFPIPSFVLKTAMGEMSKILLNSNRVMPNRLLDSGFVFKFDTLDKTVADLQLNPGK
jgi:uncharacterized protein (TIGR01777 family)